MRICITVIYYDNAEEIRTYLDALAALTHCEVIRVVMVVNKGSAEDAFALQDYAEKIGLLAYVYVPNENLGYLNGFLFGYNEYVAEAGAAPDWAIISNTDIRFCSPDFLKPFTEHAYGEDIGVVGPSIFNPKFQEYQSPHCLARRSKRSLQARALLFSIPILRNIYVWLADSRYKNRVTEKPGSSYAYEVNGALIAFSGKFMEYFAKQHYGMLLYGEEVYIAEHARLAGMKTYYDASIEILHNEHASTKQLNTTRTAKLLRDNLRYNLREFY